MALQSAKKGKSVRAQVSREEWQRRVDLAAAYRLVDLYGMTEMSANHISARVPGEDDSFLINPYGMLYDQMHASCFVKLDLAGKVLFNPTEYGVNKAGYVIHSAIHGARHDVDCVIHTHTVAGMAVSAMKCGLLPLAQTSMRFARIAYHDYEGIALNLSERERMAANLGKSSKVMILRNHGLLTLGETVREAFELMYYLDCACQIQIDAMAGGLPNVLEMSASAAATASEQFDRPDRPAAHKDWPALLRMLERRGIDYVG